MLQQDGLQIILQTLGKEYELNDLSDFFADQQSLQQFQEVDLNWPPLISFEFFRDHLRRYFALKIYEQEKPDCQLNEFYQRELNLKEKRNEQENIQEQQQKQESISFVKIKETSPTQVQKAEKDPIDQWISQHGEIILNEYQLSISNQKISSKKLVQVLEKLELKMYGQPVIEPLQQFVKQYLIKLDRDKQQKKKDRMTYEEFIELYKQYISNKKIKTEILPTFRAQLQQTIQEYQQILKTCLENEYMKNSIQSLIENMQSQLIVYDKQIRAVQNIEPQIDEKRQKKQAKGLREIYDFYCKLPIQSGKKETFEQTQYQKELLNIAQFFKFLKDFRIVCGTLSIHQKDFKIRRFLKRDQACIIFTKNSSNSKFMNFEQFVNSLKMISDIIFNKQYDILYPPIEPKFAVAEKPLEKKFQFLLTKIGAHDVNFLRSMMKPIQPRKNESYEAKELQKDSYQKKRIKLHTISKNESIQQKEEKQSKEKQNKSLSYINQQEISEDVLQQKQNTKIMEEFMQNNQQFKVITPKLDKKPSTTIVT